MTFWMWVWLAVVVLVAIGVRWFSRYLLARDARLALRRDAMLDPAHADDPERGRPRPWVILNPSKLSDPSAFRTEVDRAAARLGVSHVHWLLTTVEDPGTGQAIEALAKGASIVIAAGGDGTVRAVAAGLAGSGVRMGVIPVGTGNLLARNLALPIDDVPAAVRVALGPDHRLVDCGWLRVDAVDEASGLPAEGMLVRQARTAARVAHGAEPPVPASIPATDEYAFVVIAGLGFDGETMAQTDSDLKKRIGWVAYVVAALGAIAKEGTRLRLLLRNPKPADDPVGDAPRSDEESRVVSESATLEGLSLPHEPETEVTWVPSRTIMFANCGELPYITLAPGARLDDGLLDVIAVDTGAGLLGWADLSWKILAQGVGVRTFNLPASTGTIRFRQAEGASVSAQTPQVVQVDGDAIGTARIVHARVDRGALDIAVPPVD
ncbi:diacylglycerol/lipid kinase family protein [Actinomyces culturomici]|uniref:diacylglycerol/lipid kinase family protein n=1 Tax=Actinomyces culturomici TaxID=1926276 RepID=UPI000E2064F7|nr:diacylglycerol kinase family protein [Actinomyces culturomici]